MSAVLTDDSAARVIAAEVQVGQASAEHPNLVHVADDAVVYFPLGMHPSGASYSILVHSDAGQRLAHRFALILGFGYVGAFFAIAILNRLFVAWPIAVCLDLLIGWILRHVSWRFAQRLGTVIPPLLSAKICADRIGAEGLQRLTVQNWVGFAFAVVAAAFGLLLGEMRFASIGLTILPVVIESALKLKQLRTLVESDAVLS